MKKLTFLILLMSGCTFKAVEDEKTIQNGNTESKHESIDIEASSALMC